MESALKPPGKIDFDDVNLALALKRWKEELTLYLDLDMDDKEETFKVKLLYDLIGEKGREICETPGVGCTKSNPTLDEVLEALTTFCDPKKNERVERYNFFTRSQA